MKKKAINALKKSPLHFLFWLIVWFFFFSFFSVGTKNIDFIFWFSTLLSIITIVSTYQFIYQLIPNYLIHKKYKLFTLYTFYSLVFIVCAVLVTVVFGFVFFYNLEFKNMPALTKNYSVILICVLLIIVLASSFKILKYNYQSLEEKKTLENKFLQTQLQLKEQELKFLKMQIHPHFLFNTLNTLYGFALKKADETPGMILKLSDLLDYILYQVDKPTVFLVDEIKHIKNYIALEKSRFQESLQVDFSVNLEDHEIQIPPMLLLPFVENAFKHGVQIDNILKIKINLEVKDKYLVFEVNNYVNTSSKTKSGIGLENIKKRLNMLYGLKSSILIKETKKSFTTYLKVPLKNKA